MMKAARTRLYRNDQRLLLSMLGISVAFHLVLGVFLTLVPSFVPTPSPLPPYVTVEMVNMAPVGAPASKAAAVEAPAVEAPAGEPIKEEPVAEEPVKEASPPAPEPKPAEKKAQVKPVEPAEKPVEKPAEKAAEKLGTKAEAKKAEAKPAEPTRTAEPAEDFEAAKKSALASLEKKVEARARPDSVSKAIAALRRKAASPGGLAAVGTAPAGTGHKGVAADIPAGSEGLSDAVALPKVMVIYGNELLNHINAHWAFESSLAGKNRNLVARVVVTIMRNGTISDPWFEQRSGNTYFDDSVDKAIKKSNPAPPLPPTYSGDRFQFGLIFIPPE